MRIRDSHFQLQTRNIYFNLIFIFRHSGTSTAKTSRQTDENTLSQVCRSLPLSPRQRDQLSNIAALHRDLHQREQKRRQEVLSYLSERTKSAVLLYFVNNATKEGSVWYFGWRRISFSPNSLFRKCSSFFVISFNPASGTKRATLLENVRTCEGEVKI